MWIFPHSTKTGLIRCLFQCNSRLKPLHLNSWANYYVSRWNSVISLQCSNDQSLMYSCIHLTHFLKLWSSSFSQDSQRIPRFVCFIGCAVVFPACTILGNACIQTLVVHLFLNLMKSDGCMWPLASWMCQCYTLPCSRAYVVFLHGVLVTSVQLQVHKLNSIPNLKLSMYECRGLCLTAVWKLTFSVLPIHTTKKMEWNDISTKRSPHPHQLES